MDYQQLFDSMFPGFFRSDRIKGMPEDHVFTELVLDLRGDEPPAPAFRCPEGLTFGEYAGKTGPLREAVGLVAEDWVQYFGDHTPVFCAFDGDRIASFCILSDWGWHQGLLVGGPGCVGTVPEYRGKGIGLELVRLTTNLLREKGFDLSWIHYTHLERWYQKLGYQTVLRWNCKGITES